MVALQLQTQSALDGAILPDEDDNNGNPDQSSDGKAKDESGNTVISTMHELNLHICDSSY